MQIPSEVIIWTFGAIQGNLKSTNHYVNDKGYSLHCKTNNQYLIWNKGQVSVNLDYESQPHQTKYHFALPDKAEREIKTGEDVAMAIGGGEAYLYYANQTVGINLKWSTEPKYEWKIFTASGNEGELIQTGTPCALVNTKVQPSADFLVHMDKHAPKVVNLGWTSSPDWLKDLVNKAAKEAAQKAILAIMA